MPPRKELGGGLAGGLAAGGGGWGGRGPGFIPSIPAQLSSPHPQVPLDALPSPPPPPSLAALPPCPSSAMGLRGPGGAVGQLMGLGNPGAPAPGCFPAEDPGLGSELAPAAADPLLRPRGWALVSPKFCLVPSQESLRLGWVQGLRAGAGLALLCGGGRGPPRMLRLLRLRPLPSCHVAERWWSPRKRFHAPPESVFT